MTGHRVSLAILVVAVLVAVSGGPLAAGVAVQQSVAGIVVDAESLQPLPGAQIEVVGTTSGTLTDSRGRFLLVDVTGQQVRLRITLIGYRTLDVAAAVGGDVVRVALEQTAISLDEVVVTGTPAGEQRRALGNAVSTVNASALAEIVPAQHVGNLLNGRAPGVVLQAPQGVAGGGERILIRGRGSMAFVGSPLIYVDGVRVNNDFISGPSTPEANAPRSLSRLNDIDPGDIESIEIIKGPAAATLYGTEASAGVIQIITKRGRPGAARFDMEVRQGINHFMNAREAMGERWGLDASGSVFTFNPIDILKDRTGSDYFRNGHIEGYGLSVSGGTETMQYYVSGDWDREEGILPSNTDERFRGRANLTFQPHDDLVVNTSIGLTESRTTTFHYLYYYAGRYALPVLLDTPANGFLGLPPDVQNATQDLSQEVNHVTTSIQFSHNPADWFSHRFTIGYDRTDMADTWLVPFIPEEHAVHFSPTDRLGSKDIEGEETTFTTVDYSATVNRALTDALGSSSSVGFQLYRKFVDFSALAGQQFPAPGVESLAGITGPRQVSESVLENTTVGLYLQQQVSWNDRLFVTAAVRGDDNSAFGSEFDIVTYPKVSGSWVVSEEDFWNLGSVNALRLRAAYGESGQQPDAFAAIRTYRPIPGWQDRPGGSPQFIGNPDLGPERSREIEAGFDAGLFDDRVGLEVSYYHQTTTDAIIARDVAPSSGFPSSQFVNAGEIENQGIEALVSARVLESGSADIDLGLNISFNRNEVISLNIPGVDAIATGWIPNLHKPGYPVGSYFGRKVVSATAGGDGSLENVLCDNGAGGTTECTGAPDVYLGPNMPHTEGSGYLTVTLFDRLRLGALVDFKLGRKYLGADKILQCLFLANHEVNFHPDRFSAVDRALCEGYPGVRFWDGPVIIDGSFTKLREISLTYTLPDGWLAPIRADRAILNLGARNIHTWYDRTPFHGGDPEVFTNVNFGSSNHDQAVLPLPFQFTTTLRVTF